MDDNYLSLSITKYKTIRECGTNLVLRMNDRGGHAVRP